jgi:hypothetical protein
MATWQFWLIATGSVTLWIWITAGDRRFGRLVKELPTQTVIYTFDISQHNQWKEHYDAMEKRGVMDVMAASGMSNVNFQSGDTVKYTIPTSGLREMFSMEFRRRKDPVLGTVIEIDDKTMKVQGECKIDETNIMPLDARYLPKYMLVEKGAVLLVDPRTSKMYPQKMKVGLESVEKVKP